MDGIVVGTAEVPRSVLRARRASGSHLRWLSQPLTELDANVSPPPRKNHLVELVKQSSSGDAILKRLIQVVEEQGNQLKEQDKQLKQVKEQVKELQELKEQVQDQQRQLANLKKQMDDANFDLYIQDMGLGREVPAYGLLEYLHLYLFSPKVREKVREKVKEFEQRGDYKGKNSFLKMLHAGKISEATYEHLVSIPGADPILKPVEADFLSTIPGCRMTTHELRALLRNTISVLRTARNKSCHSLTLGDKDVRKAVAEDLEKALKTVPPRGYEDLTEVLLAALTAYVNNGYKAPS